LTVTKGQQLSALLQVELAMLEQAATALEAERDALTRGLPSDIDSAVAAKDAALECLAQQQAKRTAALQTQLGTATAGLTAAIAQLDNQVENLRLQALLLALGERCTSLNRVNARLVDQLQARTRVALRVLRSTDTELRLYAVDGSSPPDTDRQTLGRA